MNGQPILEQIARALAHTRLEAVLVGNAAAALQGAPVTTLDFDFMFRETRTNLKKLRSFATLFQAVIMKPYYPASSLYRMVNEDRGLQIDFMSVLHGIRSFNGLRSRASNALFSGYPLLVADLRDIITSKRAAGRPRDMAVLDILEKTLHEKKNLESRASPKPQERK